MLLRLYCRPHASFVHLFQDYCLSLVVTCEKYGHGGLTGHRHPMIDDYLQLVVCGTAVLTLLVVHAGSLLDIKHERSVPL